MFREPVGAVVHNMHGKLHFAYWQERRMAFRDDAHAVCTMIAGHARHIACCCFDTS